jgi:hypothetical protein
VIIQDKRRLRGVTLKLLYANAEKRWAPFDQLTLGRALELLHFDVYTNLLHEILQDLKERGLATFIKEKNPVTGERLFCQIQILPAGRDIVEATRTDAAVDVE